MSMPSSSADDFPVLADELAKEWRSSLPPSQSRSPHRVEADPSRNDDQPSPKIN
jgi:hypothetical protein